MEDITAPAAPVSFESAVDATFDKIGSGDTPPPAAEPAAEQPPEMDSPGAPETPEGADAQQSDAEAAPDAETQPQPEEPPVEPYDKIEPDRVSADGKQYFFSKGKAQALLAARDFQHRISEAIPNANIDTIKQYFDNSVRADEMVSDYDSGDPERISKFVNFWAGKSVNPQSVMTFADQFIETAQRAHPQAFGLVRDKVMGSEIQGLYSEATRTGDAKLLALAQNLDYRATGKFYSAEDLSKSDPRDQQMQQFEQERQRFYAERNAESQKRMQEFGRTSETAAQSAVEDEIKKALEVIPADVRKLRAQDFKHAQRDLMDAVEEAKKANPTWQREYELRKRQAQSTMSDESKSALVAMVRQFAQNAILRNRKSVLESFNATVQSTSAAAHQKQQQAAARREPAGSNVPVQRASISQKLRSGKMSYDDAWKLATESVR